MAKLTDEQLMILDNLLYLREIASNSSDRKYRTVGEFISYITIDGENIDEYKIRKAEKEAKILSLEAAGKFSEAKEISQIPIEEYSVEAINNGSFQKAVDLVKSQDALMKLEIAYTSGDYKDALMAEGADKYCVDGLTAVCFKDEDGNATVIYRGTDGYTAWSENAQAACMVDTPYQQKALNFFENIPGLTKFNDVQLSGHSKGGNMVQYVTIVSAYSYMISHALTYDGQGFSDYFMETYRTLIAQNKDKIVSYSAEYDVVNALLYQLDIPRYYLESSIVSFIPFDHHYPEVIFNENNTLNDYASESEYRKQVNALIQWTIEYLRIEYDDETVVQDVQYAFLHFCKRQSH